MITASIVTYNDHLLDIEAILRSIIASPIRKVWIIDHSDRVFSLREELQQYMHRDKDIREHIERGFQIEYLHEDNVGYGRGNNRAIRLAMEEGCQYHLVVNPDVWFSSDVIPTIWKYMEEHPEVGQIMPKVLFLDGKIQPLAKLLPTPMDMFCRMILPEWMFKRRNKRYELADSGYKNIMNVPCLSGCFMFLRTSTLQECGLFDERYFMYAEDFDLTRRIHRHFKTLFFPNVTIFHKFNRGSHRSLRLFLIHTMSMVRYFNKFGWFYDKERYHFNRQLLQEIKKLSK
ncbi:MAG: glycosyltransferase [Bacteroidaceae bacterium]|nr:glycosyltransferase [Bacteroidaceae bacterium]